MRSLLLDNMAAKEKQNLEEMEMFLPK